MANYTPTTAFGPKDALANGDPAKVILGTEIDTEYNNIATAIASKFDSSTGLPTLVSNNAWTGSNKFSGAASPLSGAGGVALGTRSSTGAIIDWYDSTEGADLKDWFAYTSSGAFLMGAGNDAGTSSANFLHVTRSTFNIASIILGNTIDKAPITLNGTVTIPIPPGAAVALDVTGGNSFPAAAFRGSSGQWGGIVLEDNSASQDWIVASGNVSGTTGAGTYSVYDNTSHRTKFAISTAGVISGDGPTAAALVDMTPDKGTFTGTPTGVSSGGPFLCTWYRIGPLVTLVITNPNTICTSNASTFTMTGLPAAIQPASILAQQVSIASSWLNGGASASNAGAQIVANNGTVTFFVAGNQSGWISSSTKGPSGSGNASFVLQYLLL